MSVPAAAPSVLGPHTVYSSEFLSGRQIPIGPGSQAGGAERERERVPQNPVSRDTAVVSFRSPFPKPRSATRTPLPAYSGYDSIRYLVLLGT
eukprot:1619637-Rhodomonas_salina.2